MDKTVTVILRGGLGNQMFEYASAFSLARRSNAKLLVDTTFLNDRFPRPQFTHRTYDLDMFDLDPEFTAFSKISSSISIPGVWLGLDLVWDTIKNTIGVTDFIKEKKTYAFDKSVYNTQNSVVLWGFWQVEKYFIEYAEDLRGAFRFRNPLTGEAAAIGKEIQKTNSVSLHVRRGDYLLPKYASVYGAAGVGYYEKAIAYIAERVQDPTFFIFSDDIAWCREHIKPPFPTVYMHDSFRGPKSSFHFHLMSLCHHNIITNSSFSWWGAWLNNNREKIVIAPQEWERGVSSKEVIAPGWISM